ncbi:uncharacterized protein TRIREDRAFT_110761 [Trichoderma reesei QM6a]|uniref:Predicted protein n=2 Tax=Hypocrea jecorina TaxID=51453 RepID=G0RSV6_HYPJQ|nr:uncharacterized protein TRIREDRAFT_110761 [Trichoderma reesei QM6a]EGR45750.1 predicted protein [Trichoderma reesei QM6a]ETS01866.1 hypothetical protein M419DRAFT_35681 [Trichoderma reesei RUT C-30]
MATTPPPMAAVPILEQLCVTTAIIGLLAIGGKTIDSLYEMNTSPGRDTAILNKALQELKQCRSSVHILYKNFSLLEAGSLPYPDRATWISTDDLVATLTDTVLAVSDLQEAIEPIERCQGLAARVAACAQHAQRLSNLSTRIRWHNLTMNMMMTILKCPGEQDAQNSRLGLERRMTRLLSSNSDLALRMRRLRDTFGARSMARRAIPNYAPVAQNAPRLPADRTSSASSISEISASTTSGQSGQHTATDGEAAPPPRLWSIFSGYNLADIPVLSMIPLPVLTLELRDNEFYTFDFAQRVSDDLVELMQLDPGQQGTSKMLRVILSKPMVALPPGTAGMNTTPNTTTVPLEAPPVVAPANTTTTTTTTTTAAAAKSESVRMSKMIKSFKNPLKHHIRRKKLK